ncbi:MAG: hypothetical protein K2N90_13630 [Lachnospiraceae bacterium]|nr:hypothetical protein [Lachnospiraceae bacterium]
MGISEMTQVSYFFVVLAVLFGIIAVIMYFALDIGRCWRIVRGRHSAVVRENALYAVAFDTECRGNGAVCEKTERLVPDKTETPLLETMTLVQDIFMTDAGNCVNP